MSILTQDATLKGALVRLLPQGVCSAVVSKTETPASLWPAENQAIARAVPERQREFALGRTAIRQALARLHHPAVEIPMGSDRAPIWPKGIVGSLTHDQDHCIALVGHAAEFRAIGTDIEGALPLAPALLDTVCLPEEKAWLRGHSPQESALLAKRIFSAKEAAFKCQYPLTKAMFGFERIAISLDPAHGRFSATFVENTGVFAAGSTLAGYNLVIGCQILSLVFLPQERKA